MNLNLYKSLLSTRVPQMKWSVLSDIENIYKKDYSPKNKCLLEEVRRKYKKKFMGAVGAIFCMPYTTFHFILLRSIHLICTFS